MARKKSRKPNNTRSFPALLLLLGILLFSLGTISHLQILVNSVKLGQKEAPRSIQSGQDPKLIAIPSADINVDVVMGGIVNGNWVLSDTAALYLPSSGKIGEGYNTIVYAHNTEGLFKNLKNIKTGDFILVKDNKENIVRYKVFSIEDIDPKDVDKLYSNKENVLTLFTCDGWFDSKRLLVRAKLDKAK